MHASRSLATAGVTIYLLLQLCVSTATTYSTKGTYRNIPRNVPWKCCPADHAFNEDLECVHVEPDKFNYTTHRDNDRWQAIQQHPQQIVTVVAFAQGLSCRDDPPNSHFLRTYAKNPRLSREYCVERMINGTVVLAKCPRVEDDSTASMTLVTRTTITTVTTITMTTIMTKMTMLVANASSNVSSNVSSQKGENVPHCNHGLRTIVFWGAQTYMDTNVAHMILCIIVVIIYLFVPELGKSIHNRAVLRHNICLMSLGCILTLFGYCELRECPMSNGLTTFLWITLQYFTNATGFWLNVICFDMTLSITRFRWTVGSGQRTNREENRQLLLYGTFAWGGALIPAVIAFILEYYPGIPEDFPLKPNYIRYHGGPNLVVNLYFFGIPLITLFWNNVLFVFTTYKIIRIQRSTEIATRNQTNVLRKKYFLFLQMYLLMGAPWFFGSLLACMNNLVILKICRLYQPMLWLLMLPTHKKLRQKFSRNLPCTKKREDNATAP